MRLTSDTTGTYIFTDGLSDQEYIALRQTQAWKWNRTKHRLEARITAQLLTELSEMGPLPEWAEDIRKDYVRRDTEMQRLRNEEHPEPVVPFPVRAKLYEHQIRGANMALCAFGIARGGDAGTVSQSRGFGLLYEMGRK